MRILDQFSAPGTFTPTSLNGYFALQLAKRLSDQANVSSSYAQLCEHFSEDHLLSVYRAEVAAGPHNLAARFRGHFH